MPCGGLYTLLMGRCPSPCGGEAWRPRPPGAVVEVEGAGRYLSRRDGEVKAARSPGRAVVGVVVVGRCPFPSPLGGEVKVARSLVVVVVEVE